MRLVCRFRELRGKRTQAEIAEAAGISQAYISQLEKGTMVPRDEWIEGLERAYGAAIGEFYATFVTSTNGGRMLVELAGDEEG